MTSRTASPSSSEFLRTPLPQSLPVRMTAEEILSRCTAAARWAMKGKQYTPHDRAECAAHVAAVTLGKVRDMETAPRPWTLEVAALDAFRARMSRTSLAHLEDGYYLPTHLASFTRLAHLAANYRRSVDRERARVEAEAVASATDDFSAAGPDTLSRPPALTPDAAHAAARDMLGALGLPRMGKAYPLAYTAAREWIALEAEVTETGKETGRAVLRTKPSDIAAAAAELGYRSGEALTMARNRAAARIPSVKVYGRDAHAAALGLEVEASPARKASATRMASASPCHAGSLRDYIAPDDHAPVSCRAGEAVEVSADDTAAWTRDLPAATRTRLAHAAQVKRARAAAKTEAQRCADRIAAGLPGAVL